MAIACGQFSIVDISDSKALTGFISSNLKRTQVYSPDNDTYSPDWSNTNLVLTAELYVAGNTKNIITDSQVQSVKWYKDTETTALTTGGSYVISGSKNHILTINSNLLTDTSATDFICVINFKDSDSGLNYTHKMSISFSKVSSGGGLVTAVAYTPNGNVFKNNSIATLTAVCDLWRNGAIDNTNVAYQWYVQSSDAEDVGGGIGWAKVANATGKYSGATTNTLTIYADSVTDISIYKCIITDNDSTSSTNGSSYFDFVTILDISDTIQVTIESTGGNIFKNSQGSTTLKARLFQAGEEIDEAGTKYTYKWYKYDKSGNLVSNFGGTGVNFKDGKSLTVGASDVSTKATFKVEIS